MKRRLIFVTAITLLTTCSLWSNPAIYCQDLPQSNCHKRCHDEAELVVSYCMIVHGDINKCTNQGADYEDACREGCG